MNEATCEIRKLLQIVYLLIFVTELKKVDSLVVPENLLEQERVFIAKKLLKVRN